MDLCILVWMERCWKRGSDDWTVCCSPCLAVTFKPGISFRGRFSCQSHWRVLSAAIWCLFQWHSQLHGNLLKFTYLLQSGIFISSSFSCQAFTLTGSYLFHWQLSRASASVSPLSQPFLLFLVCLCRCRSFPPLIWVSREAGSLPLSVFTLSTQLLSFTRSFKLPKHAKAKLAGEVVRKSYYVCMRLAAIALNYSVKDIRHDVRQIIYIYIIYHEKSQLNRLVWGSLTLAPTILYVY